MIGLSDPSKGIEGAKMSAWSYGFEKHFLPHNKIKKVGDFKLSLNPKEMKNYV